MQLSIYVGLRSIGWLVTQELKLIQYGIKRLNLSFDNYYEYIAGLPVSKRINRRQKRTTRRNLLRFKRRREKLKGFLLKNEFITSKKYTLKEKLQLRQDAAVAPINRNDLGIVLLQIATKRGYKSMRGASMSDASEYLQTIAQHEENLKNYHSVGEYLSTLKSLKDVVLLRETYEREFYQICEVQKLQEDIIQKLHKIIFSQRPIKQNNTTYCKYERRKVMHGSNPNYQVFRCWRDANNIIIWDENENEIEIHNDWRSKWAHDLYHGRNLTKASVLKDLGIKKATNYSWLSGKSLIGYELNKICKNFDIHLTEELWQDLFSATDNSRLQKLLLLKYQLKNTQVEILCEADIHAYGWSEFSAKAVKKLLPKLKSGIKLSEAIMQEYGKVDFKEVALRNLILEQHFFSSKSLVEKICQKYEITEFKFEIDTLLKMGNKMRKANAQERRKDLGLRKKYAKELEGKTDYEFQKLKAWLELKGPKGDLPAISPLEPDKEITLEEALSEDYNFDHIVPKSKIFERSPKNLILCKKSINEEKGRKTALDFAEEKGIYHKFIEVAENLPTKKQMLVVKENEIIENAVTSRQNADYNTKCFSTLFQGSINIPNKVINHFQREWFAEIYSNSDARFSLQKAWVLSNFTQQDLIDFDNIRLSEKNLYKIEPKIDKIENWEQIPVFIPRIKHTRKNGNTLNPRARLHEETIFGKIIIDKKVFYRCRKPLQGLSDKAVKSIIDKPLKEFIENEIQKSGSLENAKEKWSEENPIFNGNELKSVSFALKSDALVPVKMKDGVFVDYVYPDARHSLIFYLEKDKLKKEQYTLLQLFENVKNGNFKEKKFYLQGNSIVEIKDKKYFLLGVSDAPIFRSVYELNAVNQRTNAEDLKNIIKLEVNELGETIKRINIYGNT